MFSWWALIENCHLKIHGYKQNCGKSRSSLPYLSDSSAFPRFSTASTNTIVLGTSQFSLNFKPVCTPGHTHWAMTDRNLNISFYLGLGNFLLRYFLHLLTHAFFKSLLSLATRIFIRHEILIFVSPMPIHVSYAKWIRSCNHNDIVTS